MMIDWNEFPAPPEEYVMRVDDEADRRHQADEELRRMMAQAERRRQDREAINDIAAAVLAALMLLAGFWILFGLWGWL